MRYDNITILKDKETKVRYQRGVKYPDIPYSNDDIYIISVSGDRLDVLAEDYLGSVDDYWILAVANGMRGDSLYVPSNIQFRIPANIEEIKRAFSKLNSI